MVMVSLLMRNTIMQFPCSTSHVQLSSAVFHRKTLFHLAELHQEDISSYSYTSKVVNQDLSREVGGIMVPCSPMQQTKHSSVTT